MARPNVAQAMVATAIAAGLGLAACRAIIGYKPLSVETADASTRQDGDTHHVSGSGDACPRLSPTTLFTTTTALGALFVGGGYVYAAIINPFTPVGDGGPSPLYSANVGLVSCPKSGCNGDPRTLFDYTTIVDASAWGGATATDAGLFYTLPTATPDGGPLDAAAGSVMRAALDGTGASLVTSGLRYPYLIAAEGRGIYWTDDPASLSGSTNVAWTVRAAESSSAGSDLVVEGYAGGTTALFADSKNLYVLGTDESGDEGLFFCPLPTSGAGGCNAHATEIVANIPQESGFAPPPLGPGVYSFAADGANLFEAVAEYNGQILRYDLVTHAPTVLATGQVTPSTLAVDAVYAYWTTYDSDAIYYTAKDGSTGVSRLVCGLSGVSAIAVDGARVYFEASDPKNANATLIASVPAP